MVSCPNARTSRSPSSTRDLFSSARRPRRSPRWAARSTPNAGCGNSACPLSPATTVTTNRRSACAKRPRRWGCPCSSKPAPAAAGAACASSTTWPLSTKRSTRRNAKRWRHSATTACCSNAICAGRGTSNSRFWPTPGAPRCIWASVNARSSAGIRKCSKRRRRSHSIRRCAPRWARPPSPPRVRLPTRTPERPSSCSTKTGSSISWR